MIAYRALLGLAALLTALLVQATVVSPATMSIPVSVPLVLVLAAAVLAGPSTGIGFGFGAGLLADLASAHPMGLLAFTWLCGGLVAGVFGGVLTATAGDGAPSRRTLPRRIALRCDQCLFIGAAAALTSAFAASLNAVLSAAHDPLTRTLLLCLPAGLLDAALAVLVVPAVAAAVNCAALRPRATTRHAPARYPTLPVATDSRPGAAMTSLLERGRE